MINRLLIFLFQGSVSLSQPDLQLPPVPPQPEAAERAGPRPQQDHRGARRRRQARGHRARPQL